MGATCAGDMAEAVACARQAQRIDPAGLPGWIARLSNDHLMLALLNSGDVSSAWQRCADGLVLARHAGGLVSQTCCLGHLAHMDWLAGRIPDGWAHLRESTEIATRVGHPLAILNCEDIGGHLCAATRRWAEAVTLWAALDAHTQNGGFMDVPLDVDRRRGPPWKARQALGGLGEGSDLGLRGSLIMPYPRFPCSLPHGLEGAGTRTPPETFACAAIRPGRAGQP